MTSTYACVSYVFFFFFFSLSPESSSRVYVTFKALGRISASSFATAAITSAAVRRSISGIILYTNKNVTLQLQCLTNFFSFYYYTNGTSLIVTSQDVPIWSYAMLHLNCIFRKTFFFFSSTMFSRIYSKLVFLEQTAQKRRGRVIRVYYEFRILRSSCMSFSLFPFQHVAVENPALDPL